MTALALERTCAAADLEQETAKEIHRLQRQMQSGRPLVDTASSTRRLGQVRHVPSARTFIRPQDLL